MVRICFEIPVRRRRYSSGRPSRSTFRAGHWWAVSRFSSHISGEHNVEKHERARKQNAGVKSTIRGRQAAALDACRAAIGSLGLVCFTGAVWKLIPGHNPPMVLFVATAAWFSVSTWILAVPQVPFLPHSLILFFPACLPASTSVRPAS